MKVYHKNCKFCKLANSAQTVCMNGIGSENPKIIIWIDNPTKEEDYRHKAGASKQIEFIHWLWKRMSIPPSEYRTEFALRCHAEQKDIKTKAAFTPLIEGCSIHQVATLRKYPKAALILMGSLSSFLFTGKQKHGELSGVEWQFQEDPDRNVWITYAPGAALQAPSESPAIYRVFWKVAEQAGLKPEFNLNIEPFPFEI